MPSRKFLLALLFALLALLTILIMGVNAWPLAFMIFAGGVLTSLFAFRSHPRLHDKPRVQQYQYQEEDDQY